MARPSKTGGKAIIAKTRKASSAKGRSSAKASRGPSSATAASSKRLTVSALSKALKEAREQQAATSEVLKVISRSTFDLKSVLDTLVASAGRLCDAEMAFIMRRDGDLYRAGAAIGFTKKYIKFLEGHPLVPSRGTITGRAVLERRTVQILDVAADPEYTLTESTKLAGQRTAVGVPLLRESEPIGVIVVARQRVQAFTERQIELVRSFADQAVIAIENARLFNETKEALEQQTATSDILAAINGSGGDLAPVFESILEKAHQLCGAPCGSLQLYQDGRVLPVAIRGMTPAFAEFLRRGYPITEVAPDVLLMNRPLQRLDMVEVLKEMPDVPSLRAAVELGGIRTMTSVPLVKDGVAFGRIIAARREVRGFDDKQIATLQGFAAQAVIAIENARLLQELRARTDDLAESLRQQTATADVLKVISRSAFDIQSVLNTLTESAARLCEANSSHIYLVDGEAAHLAACSGFSDEYEDLMRRTPLAPGRGSLIGRTLQEGGVVHLLDALADKEYKFHEAQKLGHFRTMLGIPLVRDRATVGVIAVTRSEVRPFTDKQIELVQTFADQAVIAIENVRLFEEVQSKTRDLEESLRQQTATADVLKVISRSAFDLQTVLETLTESAARLCGADMAAITRQNADGGYYHATRYNFSPEWAKVSESIRLYPESGSLVGRVLLVGKAVQIPDVLADSKYAYGEQQKVGGYRTLLGVPLLRSGQPVGVLFLGRKVVEPFAEKQIDLVSTFADQAVIAIENARLFDEVQAKTRDLEESLRQQTATADVLKVISRSAFDLKSVLTTLTESAKSLCGGSLGMICLRDGEVMRLRAESGCTRAFVDFMHAHPIRPGRETITGRVFMDGKPVHVADVKEDPEYRFGNAPTIGAYRAVLAVPLMRDGAVEGVLLLGRPEPGPFSQRQLDLVQTFADQAVIAIENTRLFNETQEALARQTATSDILRVISGSPTDVQPVFDAIVQTAVRLTGCDRAFFMRVDGETYTPVAGVNRDGPIVLGPPNQPVDPTASFPSRAIATRQMLHLPDWTQIELPEYERLVHERHGVRSSLLLPLLRGDDCIGLLALVASQPNMFGETEIALAESFRDQALIAIENARLFNETREALERQTATADILKVIAGSPSDVQPVFEAIATRANSLVGGFSATVFRFIDGMAHLMAFTPTTPEADEILKSTFPSPVDSFAPFQMARDGEVTQVPDTETLTDEILDISRARGFRSMVFAPLMNKGASIGLIAVTRLQTGAFSDHHVQLLQTFADQAVIAIENARLFDEVQAKTHDLEEALRYQTGSANILNVIASSPTDVQPVLTAIVENACELCVAYDAVVALKEGDELQLRAHHGPIPMNRRRWANDRTSASGRAIADRRPVHIHDVLSDQDGRDFAMARDMSVADGCRTLLSTPLLHEGEAIGAIVLRRIEVHPFNEKQTELLKSFADQAVIAISNVKLFEQVQKRTRELSQSLDDLRAAQDRLVQTEKLASLGQLTAGIAHEIKNPLNFVNNFSSLSVELTDELHDLLKQAELAGVIRAEVDELTGMLKGNLEKVVQHGKRADSIVKNMLLHSRDGSGERRPADINTIVEESLNLAYHGARAEKSGFDITLQRDLDPAAGMIDLYPQEITRVFLNLISNGFYAANKRRETGDAGFEPSLTATTKSLGNRVEIRIRDNGTGIPEEVREKMFNPFFTTKPAGEGTGLGLSMSHDIVVKQHGGTIDVETEPGAFTEFIITLPRETAAPRNIGG